MQIAGVDETGQRMGDEKMISEYLRDLRNKVAQISMEVGLIDMLVYQAIQKLENSSHEDMSATAEDVVKILHEARARIDASRYA